MTVSGPGVTLVTLHGLEWLWSDSEWLLSDPGVTEWLYMTLSDPRLFQGHSESSGLTQSHSESLQSHSRSWRVTRVTQNKMYFFENMKICQNLKAKRFHDLVISDSKLFLQCWKACHALSHCKNNFESEMTRTWKRFAPKMSTLGQNVHFWKYENMPKLKGKTFSWSSHFWFKVVFAMWDCERAWQAFQLKVMKSHQGYSRVNQSHEES